MPPCTPLTACTVTASRSVKEVTDSLEMSTYSEVTLSWDHFNIYDEVKHHTDIDTDILPFITTLREKVFITPRVLVYYHSHGMGADLYSYVHFHYELEETSYIIPSGLSSTLLNCIGCLRCSMQAHLLNALAVDYRDVFVVFAAIALSIGIYLPQKYEHCAVLWSLPEPGRFF